jgi:hypothetical protein
MALPFVSQFTNQIQNDFDERKSEMNEKNHHEDQASSTSRMPESCVEEAQDLKTIRETHGITLQDIFRESRVSVVNLHAIESGNYSLLPPPFIAKSFIKIYANAIGVNAEAIIRNYEQYVKKTAPPPATSAGFFVKR